MNSSTSADHSQLTVLWIAAVERYKKNTDDNLLDLTKWASVRDSDDVVSLLDASQTDFEVYRTKGESVRKHLKPLLEFVKAFSDVAKEAVSTVFPPAAVIFAGINHLLESSNGVSENYDAISGALETVSDYVTRLKVLTRHEVADELVSIVIKSLEQVLALLSVTERDIKKGRALAFLQKLRGRKGDIELIAEQFEKIFQEEDQMLQALIYDNGRTSKLNEIREHLKYTHPKPIHMQARKRHQQGTGLWMLKGSRYGQWRDSSGKAMWIHGLPGTGKTLLFSSVIEDLLSRFRVTSKYRTRNNCGVAYFYCTIRDQSTLTSDNIVRSLLMQLVYQCPHIPNCITALYEKRHEGPPDLDALVSALKDVILLFKNVYVLIDALDECSRDTKSELPSHLKKILDLQDHIHLLVTSRPDFDLSLGFDSMATLESDLDLGLERDTISRDIVLYLRNTLNTDPSFSVWDKDTRTSVVNALSKKANGMFLWVHCQLHDLKTCFSPDQVKTALDNLPKDLYETYDRILGSVESAHLRDVYIILQWVIFSASPMRLDQLCDALTVDLSSPEKPCVSQKYRTFRPDLLLVMCSSLVTLENDRVSLSHASVRDYLLSHQISKDITSKYQGIGTLPFEPSVSEHFLASSCLVYLIGVDEETDQFRRYAWYHWSTHLYNSGLMDLPTNLLQLLQSYLYDSKPLCSTLALLEHMDACIYHHKDEIMISLLHHNCVSLDGQIDRDVVLHYAARRTSEPLLQWVIGRGANVNSSINGMTSFQVLTTFGQYLFYHWSCVELLLDSGADPNAAADNLCPLLCTAVQYMDPYYSETLLQYGADSMAIHRHDTLRHRIPFEVLQRLHPDIVPWLPSQVPSITPLHMAAFLGLTQTVKVLVQHPKADANMICDSGSPLLCALIGAWEHPRTRRSPFPGKRRLVKEYWNCIEILLEHRADINARHPGINTPLDYAIAAVKKRRYRDEKAIDWREEIIAKLIERGAGTADDLQKISRSVLDSGGDKFTETEYGPIAAVDSETDDGSASLHIPADTLAVHDIPDIQSVDGQRWALESIEEDARATRAAEETRERINMPGISREVVLVGLVLIVAILLGSMQGGTRFTST